MPKDDLEEDDKPKKKITHDDEDEEFDREIGESMEDEDDAPKNKRTAPEDDEDPLDKEDDLDDEVLKAGSKEIFPDAHDDEDEQPAPKPTFKYNLETPTMPPSDNPVFAPKQHTLDDLSEEDIAPQPTRSPFQVDRGIGVKADDEFEATYPARPQRPPVMQPEEYENDNLSIPSIRKQTPIYPPHQSRGGEYEDEDFTQRSAQQPPRQSFNPYAADQSQRFGYRDRQPKGASKWHIIILLLIGGAVIGATVYLLQNQFNFPGKPAEATPTPAAQITEATPEPTPTPAPLERSQFKVRVLNGTTESGIAKKVLDKMKELGYQTDRAGNAPKQDYAQTLIRVKEGDSTISAQLTKDLSPDYEAAIAADLDKDANVDAEIILGEK